jgi:hypothetical protein
MSEQTAPTHESVVYGRVVFVVMVLLLFYGLLTLVGVVR